MNNTSLKKKFSTNNLMLLSISLFVLFLLAGCNSTSTPATIDTENSGVVDQTTQDLNTNQNQSKTISISGFVFSPNEIIINSGDIVTWTNEDTAPHQILFTIGGKEVKSNMLNTGDKFTYKFDSSGTIDYICSVHPSMTGKIIVE